MNNLKKQMTTLVTVFFLTTGAFVGSAQEDNKYEFIRYHINPNFSESIFNEVERKNIDYLLYLEKKIP